MPSSLLTKAVEAVSRDRVVEIARALCRVPQPDGREGPRAEVAASFLEHPRIDLVVDPVLPGRPNVIARVPGRGTGPSLLLNGHLDASYAPSWSRDPHDPWVDGTRLYGQGLSDMLGGVASMIAAVEVAARLDPLPGDLVLLASMYHDSNGLGTKYALASGGEWPAYGINGEPTSLTLMTTHGGCIKFELSFAGRLAHVSRQEHGADALAAAVEVYRALRDLRFAHESHPALPGLPKLQIGVLQAGVAPASVPDTAVLRADLRTVPGMTWSTVREDLQRLLDRACPPAIRARIGCLVRQRPFIGPSGGRLVEALALAHRLVRKEALRVNVDRGAQAFVTDAVDMQAAGIESVVYGPAEWHHAPDAFVDIDELADATRVYLAAAIHFMESAARPTT
ncbi:MAG: M20/M25/M40 family metallo-hydrolase [Candidatus Rokubacteria bacterium]|nr:M20/M25/M40 family metallo-hydrolase [Candidatus Rokubacteria bacterium]